MSADNCLAILQCADGSFRVADIHMIWLNEPNRLERLMSWAENFNLSPVFIDEEALDQYVDRLLNQMDVEGRIIEYGVEPYPVEMSWADFYAKSQAKGLWRGLSGRCETCQDFCQGRGRKFEDIIICSSCYTLFTAKVLA